MRILKKYSTVLLLCFWAAFVGGCAKERTEYGPCEMRFGVSSVERTRGNAILSVDEITSIGVFGYTKVPESYFERLNGMLDGGGCRFPILVFIFDFNHT